MLISALLGAGLGAVLLVVVFKGVDLRAVGVALSSSNPFWIAVALATILGAFAIKAVRWTLMLGPAARLPVAAALPSVLVGGAGNALVSHLGEVPRAAMAAAASGVRISTLLASIVAERMFDVATVALLLASLPLLPSQTGAARHGVMSVLGIAGVAASITLVAVGWLSRRLLFRLRRGSGQAIEGKRALLLARLEEVLQALQGLHSWRQLLLVMIASLLMWLSFAAAIWCSLRAVGAAASLSDALAVLGVSAVALMLPAAPGRVGAIQASFSVVLGGSPLDPTRVLAASIIHNALVTIPLWCMAGVIWWRWINRKLSVEGL